MAGTRPSNNNIVPIISNSTKDDIATWLAALKQANQSLDQLYKEKKIGHRLYEVLKESDIAKLTLDQFIDALLKTTKPMVFAEGHPTQSVNVKGDGSDWTKQEISLLGRIARMVPDVEVYSKTSLTNTLNKDASKAPSGAKATVLFTNGALLAGCAADADRVTTNGNFDKAKYDKFLEENLLPSLLAASSEAGKDGAIITLPILGGKQFAGKYEKDIRDYYYMAVGQLLGRHASHLQNIKGVVITGLLSQSPLPVADGSQMMLMTTPNPVGTYPQQLPEVKNNQSLTKCKTYICVAADHVSFPGNDGYGGSSSTHEGGVCTVTNVYQKITGVEGEMRSSGDKYIYTPTSSGATYQEVCQNKKTTLNFAEVRVFHTESGQEQKIPFQPTEDYKPQYLSATAEPTKVIGASMDAPVSKVPSSPMPSPVQAPSPSSSTTPSSVVTTPPTSASPSPLPKPTVAPTVAIPPTVSVPPSAKPPVPSSPSPVKKPTTSTSVPPSAGSTSPGSASTSSTSSALSTPSKGAPSLPTFNAVFTDGTKVVKLPISDHQAVVAETAIGKIASLNIWCPGTPIAPVMKKDNGTLKIQSESIRMKLMAQYLFDMAKDGGVDVFMLQEVPGQRLALQNAINTLCADHNKKNPGNPINLELTGWQQTANQQSNFGTCALINTNKVTATLKKSPVLSGDVTGMNGRFSLYELKSNTNPPITCEIYNVHGNYTTPVAVAKFVAEKAKSGAIVCGDLNINNTGNVPSNLQQQHADAAKVLADFTKTASNGDVLCQQNKGQLNTIDGFYDGYTPKYQAKLTSSSTATSSATPPSSSSTATPMPSIPPKQPSMSPLTPSSAAPSSPSSTSSSVPPVLSSSPTSPLPPLGGGGAAPLPSPSSAPTSGGGMTMTGSGLGAPSLAPSSSSSSAASSASTSSTSPPSAPTSGGGMTITGSGSGAPPSSSPAPMAARLAMPLSTPIAVAAPVPVAAPAPVPPLSPLEVQVRDAKNRWEKLKDYKKAEVDAAAQLITANAANLSPEEQNQSTQLQTAYTNAAQALTAAANQVFTDNGVKAREDAIALHKQAVDAAQNAFKQVGDARQLFLNKQRTQIGTLATQLLPLKRQKQALAQQRAQLISTSNAEITTKQNQLDQATNKLQGLEDAVTQAKRDEAAKKTAFKMAKQSRDTLATKQSNISDGITDFIFKIRKQDTAIEKLEQELSAMKKAAAVSETKKDDNSIPLTTLSPASSSSSSSASTTSVSNTQKQLEDELSKARVTHQQLETELAKQRTELAQVNAQLTTAETNLRAVDSAYRAAQTTFQNAESALKNNRATLQKDIRDLPGAIQKKQNDLQDELGKIGADSGQLSAEIGRLEIAKQNAEAALKDPMHSTVTANVNARNHLQDAKQRLEDAQSELANAYNQAASALEASHLDKLQAAQEAAQNYTDFAGQVKLQHGKTQDMYDELNRAVPEFAKALKDCKNKNTLHLHDIEIFQRILTAVSNSRALLTLEHTQTLLVQMQKYMKQDGFFGDISNPQNAALQTAYSKCLNILNIMANRELEDFFGFKAQFHPYTSTPASGDARNQVHVDILHALYPDPAAPPAPGAVPALHASTGASSDGHWLPVPGLDKGCITFESQFINKCQITPATTPNTPPTVTPTDKPVSFVAYQDDKKELQIKSYDHPEIPKFGETALCRYTPQDGSRQEVVLYKSALNYAHQVLYALTAGFTKKDDIISFSRIPSQECYDALCYVAKHYNLTLTTRLNFQSVSAPSWYDTTNPTKAVKTFIEQQKTSKAGYSYDPNVQKTIEAADANIKNALKKL